jgi:hypothetical protein
MNEVRRNKRSIVVIQLGENNSINKAQFSRTTTNEKLKTSDSKSSLLLPTNQQTGNGR